MNGMICTTIQHLYVGWYGLSRDDNDSGYFNNMDEALILENVDLTGADARLPRCFFDVLNSFLRTVPGRAILCC